jgi:preprotein translocase subunit SecG
MGIGLIFGIILLVLAAALVVLVLMQSDNEGKLSGAISGGADTFYGKTKGADKSKVLTIATAVIGAVFTLLVLVMYLVL